jgi:hypothetical protein
MANISIERSFDSFDEPRREVPVMMLEFTNVARPFLSIPVSGLVLAVAVILLLHLTRPPGGGPSHSS